MPRRLEATAQQLRQIAGAGKVVAVAGDITTADARAAPRSPRARRSTSSINNAGGPPPGDFRDWQRDDWIKAVDANMLTPIELIKATVDQMAERGFGRSGQHHLGRGEGADRRARA